MLYAIDSGKYITNIPHKNQYDFWIKKISNEEYKKIEDGLNDLINKDLENDKNIQTSSWIPGNNWTGTIYEPISKACNNDQEMSSLFFGLILWITFMKREDVWSFGRYKKDDVDIKGMTYFKINKPK